MCKEISAEELAELDNVTGVTEEEMMEEEELENGQDNS